MFNKKADDSYRFKTIYEQGNLIDGGPYCEIIVDTVTGVNYLHSLTFNGSGTSIIPLLDKDGMIVVSPAES